MKVVSSIGALKFRHPDCQVVRRRGRIYVICKSNPRYYAAVHNAAGNRWLITSWKPLGRGWGNPPVPCLHADPVLPDCPAGETTKAHGWISFYEGTDWLREIERIEATKWW